MIRILLRSACLILLCSSANQYSQAQVFQWEQRTSIPSGRWGPSTFVIDSIAYVVGGRLNGTDRQEVYAYHVGTGNWTQKASIPVARRLAAAFTVGGKGYVSCGLVGSSNKLNDLWEYDPVMDTWTQRANLPGQARYGTYHFALQGLGYIGGGNIGSANGPFLSDAYQYDPITDSWSTAIALPDLARHGTTSFVMNGKGYVFGGKESSLSFSPDLWEFDSNSQQWTLLQVFPGTPRSSPLAFVFGNDAVIGCGRTESVNLYDVWWYEPNTNNWSTAPAYPGLSSLAGTSFTIQGRAFGGLGWVLDTDQSAPDLWELVKNSSNGISDISSVRGPLIYPTPVLSGSTLHFSGPDPQDAEITFVDMLGRTIPADCNADGVINVPAILSGHIVLKWRQGPNSGSLRFFVVNDR